MSPEQLEGADADARSDLFGFGAVLFEMVTGKKAFTGKSQVSVMAAILDHDPPSLTTLASSAPAALDRLVRKCLSKDPEARWQNAGDVASELEWIGETLASRSAESLPPALADANSGGRARSDVRLWLAAAIVLPTLAAAATWALMRPRALPQPQPMRFSIVPPAPQQFAIASGDRDLAISPDGTKIAYVVGVAPQRQLMLRAIDQLDAVPLRTSGNPRAPFFSPDGKWVGYFEPTELKKASTSGGPPVSICPITGAPRGGAWGIDDTIVFATNDPGAGLIAVGARGGAPEVLTKPDTAKGETDHLGPSFVSDRALLFTIVTAAGPDEAQIAVLDRQTRQSKTRCSRSFATAMLIRGGTQPEYAESGHVIYAAADGLRAVRFDPINRDVLSDPIPIVEELAIGAAGAADFSLSRTGTLVYVPSGSSRAVGRTLAWLSRDGREEPIAAPPRGYNIVRLSPDGTRVAVEITDEERDIWVVDLSRHPPPLTRLIFNPGPDTAPVWTPNGRRIAFRSSRRTVPNIFWRFADGTGGEERLTTSENGQVPLAFTPDGSKLLFVETRPKTGLDALVMAADGKTRAEPLVATPFVESGPDVSPDGRWFLYSSNESGPSQVYVRPFPNADGGRWQVSTSGGSKGVWARSGREIVYLDGNGALTSVPVQTTPTFSAGTPVKIADAARFHNFGPGRNYDISPDGKKFLIITNPRTDQTANDSPTSMVVVVNWLEELKTRLPDR